MPMTQVLREFEQPTITVRNSDTGLQLYALRDLGEGRSHVRVTNLVFPQAFVIPLSAEMTITQWHVPIDDKRCYWYALFTSFTGPVAKAEMRRQRLQTRVSGPPAVEAPAPAAVRTSNPLLTPSRLGVSQLWPTMDGVVAEPPALNVYKDGRAVAGTLTPAKRANGRHKPVQDEGGFFDPEQCGFAALLAKLDEIIDTDDRSA